MRWNCQSWSLEVRITQEDQALKGIVQRVGLRKWAIVSQEISVICNLQRSGKQCRERWYNHVDPVLNSSDWLPSEENTIFALSRTHGNLWSKIAKLLPGRSENSVKNYFYSTVRKNIRRVNKKLIFREKIAGSIREMMKKPILSDLIFCNPTDSEANCQKMIESLKLEAKADSPSEVIKPEQGFQEVMDSYHLGAQIGNEMLPFQVSNIAYLQYCSCLLACSLFS